MMMRRDLRWSLRMRRGCSWWWGDGRTAERGAAAIVLQPALSRPRSVPNAKFGFEGQTLPSFLPDCTQVVFLRILSVGSADSSIFSLKNAGNATVTSRPRTVLGDFYAAFRLLISFIASLNFPCLRKPKTQ